jgi:hypothetical protein
MVLEDYDMKIMVFCIIPIVMIMGCASSGTSAKATDGGSSGMDLDAAIKEAAIQMEMKIPSKTMVALVSVASPSIDFSTQVLTRLESAIVSSGKLVVVDRANLDKVREEQGFQLSGEVDDESAKSIGKLLGAGAIVTGSLADLGDVYSLTLKAINIETATVAVSYLADLAKSTRVETLLASGGGAQTAQRRTAGGNTTATPAPAAPTYKIGDTGPAGGLIFYDKGNNSGGWRYLEAAPEGTDTTAVFFAHKSFGKYYGAQTHWFSSDYGMTSEVFYDVFAKPDIGYGKRSTDAVLRLIVNAGEWGTALQICDELEVNGYSDWFLPSLSELSLMYGNLARKGLGDFTFVNYWSSTSGYNRRNNWYNIDTTCVIDFSDGKNTDTLDNTRTARIRAVRQF